MIKINSEKCIDCGRCVKVCPANIFHKSENENLSIQNVEICIDCGHCVATCPTGAVEHDTFPEGKVHTINRDNIPTAEQVLELMRSRRSNRVFTKDQVPMELLGQIIEAAHRAPTASNSQLVRFTIVTSPEKLSEIGSFTVNTFHSAVKLLNNPLLKPVLKITMPNAYKYVPVFTKMKSDFEQGNDIVLRGATAVVFFHASRFAMFGNEDCNLAYQNASLMAEALGVAQFYTGFVCSASKRSKNKKLAKILGIGSSIVYAGMALGMPLIKFEKYIDKKDVKVNYL